MRTHSGAKGICEKLATKRKRFTMLYIMLNTPYAEKDEAKKAGVEEAKAMNRDLFFYIGDSDCMDVLDLLDDAVEGLAKRCRAMDCIETYV